MILKRTIDVVLSIVGLLVLAIPFIVIATLILISLRSNPIFTQKRLGLNHRIIKVIKFKTMYDRTDKKGNPLPDYQRSSSLGTTLRKFSIDELPQLINVLIGNMSLVGPRPLLSEYEKHYSDFQDIRHTVRPGITGLSQVKGRNTVTWEQKFSDDVKYVNTMSFKLDMWILLRTFIHVIQTKNITPENEITVEKFNPKVDD